MRTNCGAISLFGFLLLLVASCSDDQNKASSSTSSTDDRLSVVVNGAEESIQKLPPFDGKAAQISNHEFSIHVGPSQSEGYDVRVVAFDLGWSPAAITYAGQDTVRGTLAHQNHKSERASNLFEASKLYPKSLLVSAGLSSNDGSAPVGLLMIDQEFFSPFNFNKKNGRPKYSGVLCISKSGQIFIYDADNYVSDPARISADCSSALQAFPVIVDQSRSVIQRFELTKARLPRVVVGIDKSKRRFVLVFRDPIHLYAVAQFLTTGDDRNLPISIQGKISAEAENDLRLIRKSRQVVNLPGADGAIVGAEANVVIGNARRPLTAILVVPPTN